MIQLFLRDRVTFLAFTMVALYCPVASATGTVIGRSSHDANLQIVRAIGEGVLSDQASTDQPEATVAPQPSIDQPPSADPPQHLLFEVPVAVG